MSDAVTGRWARAAWGNTHDDWLAAASWFAGASIALQSVGVPYATQMADECEFLVSIALARAQVSR